MTRNGFFSLAVAAVFFAAPAFSAGPSIGVATAVGSYSVDSSSVTGNIDVFDGTQLRTTISPSDVHLANGADVRLATRSAGTLYSDHLQLRDGAVRISNFDNYPVQVRQLQIQADTPGAQAIVRMRARTIEIASIGGTVSVTDGGAMLTRVAAGTSMAFQNSTTRRLLRVARLRVRRLPAPVLLRLRSRDRFRTRRPFCGLPACARLAAWSSA